MLNINNKLYKACDVVMLATEEKIERGLWLRKPKFETCSYLFYNILVGPVHSNEKYQHLYILSDEEIKVGDWILNNLLMDKSPIQVTKELLEDGLLKEDKKIIATTDRSLIEKIEMLGTGSTYVFNLSQPPQSFIDYFVEQFNKGNVIDKVLVEWEESYDFGWKNIKVNPDNTINILPNKDSWTKDEVNELINSFEILCKHYQGNQDWFPSKKSEWLKNNLLS